MARTPAPAVERVEWDTFITKRFAWRQGEHVVLIGPTGQGKTTLAREILKLRNFVLVVGTKPPRDETLRAIEAEPGVRTIQRVDQVPNMLGRKSMRLLLWIKFQGEDEACENRQRFQINATVRRLFSDGGWCIYVDEIWWVEDVLKLGRLCRMLLTQGRSENVSVVGATQRPAHILRLWYDQPTHLFFWRDNDETNLKRISGLNGANNRVVREIVATLAKYDVLYVNNRTGYMAITRAPKPT